MSQVKEIKTQYEKRITSLQDIKACVPMTTVTLTVDEINPLNSVDCILGPESLLDFNITNTNAFTPNRSI